jgi:competence protein ComEC
VGAAVALTALLAGIVAGEHGALGPVVVAAGAAVWGMRGSARLAVLAVVCALLGGGAMARALAGQEHSALTPLVARRVSVTVSGELTSDPTSSAYDTSALVRLDDAHRTVLVTATGDDMVRLRVIEAGDRVTVTGRLAPLRATGFDDRARWQHAVARLDDAQVLTWTRADGLAAFANSFRDEILRGLRALAPTPRALTAGFLLGDTRDIPAAMTTQYRDAGLSHLLAVSGENVAFVLALASPLLRRFRLRGRTTLALAVVLVFAAMTRFEPSVLRASAMAAIALLAAAVGRPVPSLRILAYAVTVLLAVDPFLVHSVGFWLSCAASAGIALFSAPITRRLPGPRGLRDALGVSLAAQVGVMPVLLAAFGSFPVVTPVTNLLAAPAAEGIGVYGFCAALGAGVIPRAGPLVQQPTALLVAWVSLVARAGAAVPLQVDAHGACGLAALLAAAASVACLRARRALPEAASR